MRILLLSAYHAYSHDYWLRGIVKAFPEYDWTVLALPPRYFNWRIRGNPLSWLCENESELRGTYDLVIATSTVDLATLKGLVPRLANTPCVVYFHENQFVYPLSEAQRSGPRRIEPQMVNLYSSLAADAVWFNSSYNRETFFSGCEQLFQALPDHTPSADWLSVLKSRSRVLPVPLEPCNVEQFRPSSDRLRVVWNHRWEYDKGVEQLLAAVEILATQTLDIELTLLGQRFRQKPQAMLALLNKYGGTVRDAGYIENRSDYMKELARHDVVLSTSLHDFQGLAIMEAVQAGCVPLLPDRLCYPEFFGADYLYKSSPDNLVEESRALNEKLASWKELSSRPLVPEVSMLEWPVLREAYRNAIASVLPD